MKKIILSLFIISTCGNIFSQIKISGFVLTSDGQLPIENVAIIFKNSHVTVFTDSYGKFSANIPTRESFIISHINYELSGIFVDDEISPADSLGFPTDNYIIFMVLKNNIFQPVTITASRADYNSPITYTNINGAELNKNNSGQDMPYLLQFTPGIVVTSDAGNGVGYTYIKIRGSDASRVNITINGVPYNDAESEQTYWVDLPDFAASVDDIQIQRGVGTSTYGISSLGGSVNINTNNLSDEQYEKINLSLGSFNLNKESVLFGSGKIDDHWYVEGRLSRIYSDGYIDRAFADMNSSFFTTAYKSNKFLSVLNIFNGQEKTYQAWNGVPKDSLETNRTYNSFTYYNQTDNYNQTHFQWHNTFYLKDNSSLRLTLNYTHGKGYYEEYEAEQYFPDYGIEPVIISNDTSDLITQKWLDNNFTGTYLQYQKEFSKKLNLTIGSAYYNYFGKHFGDIIWGEVEFPGYIDATQFNGEPYQWYYNDAAKKDGNVFSQMNYAFSGGINIYLDLQLRKVWYDFTGLDEDGNDAAENVDLLFFNPKAGISFQQNKNNLIYFSVAKSGKEPNRDDYVNSPSNNHPEPEFIYDAEAGEKLKIKGWQLQADVYYMYYKDQLVLNGEINDVGEYSRINVPESYRTGIELAWSKLFFNKLSWNANTSFSKNIIPDYTEYVDNWDDGTQQIFIYTNTQIAFSPSVVAASEINYLIKEFHNTNENKFSNNSFSVGLNSKYVSKQFIDNTENDFRSLDAYFLNDVSFNYELRNKLLQNLSVRFIIQNLFDMQYESNAWVYRYIYENSEQELNGYFPQAGINYVMSLNITF